MPTGLRVECDTGGIAQIDSENKNMFLLASGSKTGAEVVAGGGGVYVTVTGTANPLLFMRPKKGFVCVYSVTRSGSSVTYAILSNCGVDGFDWYVFDTIAPTASTFGLQVFAADSSLIFDSAAKPLLIKDIVVVPMLPSGDVGRSYTSLGTYDGTSIFCLSSPTSNLYRDYDGYGFYYVQVFDVVRHDPSGTYGYSSGYISAYGDAANMFYEQWTSGVSTNGPGKLIIADGRFL